MSSHWNLPYIRTSTYVRRITSNTRKNSRSTLVSKREHQKEKVRDYDFAIARCRLHHCCFTITRGATRFLSHARFGYLSDKICTVKVILNRTIGPNRIATKPSMWRKKTESRPHRKCREEMVIIGIAFLPRSRWKYGLRVSCRVMSRLSNFNAIP